MRMHSGMAVAGEATANTLDSAFVRYGTKGRAANAIHCSV
jgi:hypothetical protein